MTSIYWLLLATALAAPAPAQQQPQAATQQKSTAKAAKPAKPDAGAPPANAEKIGDGVYKATDATGKTWIYTRTPFGYSKLAESDYLAAGKTTPSVPLQVVSVDGDKVKFQRDTPFGKSTWTRLMSELNDDEKAALQASQNDSKSGKQDK